MSFLVAIVWSNRGRSGVAGFFISMFLSPILGLIIGLAGDKNEQKIEHKQVVRNTRKKCPFCAELIKPEAIVCRYCGRELNTPTPASSNIAPWLSEDSPSTPAPASTTVRNELAKSGIRAEVYSEKESSYFDELTKLGYRISKVGNRWNLTHIKSGIRAEVYSEKELSHFVKARKREAGL